MAYEPPSWSTVPPPGSYTLEIIRDGVVIETVDASTRAHYILGRDPAAAHVHLPHPSVSRQHAVIQHRDSGGVWLMDLGSTHGTTINKKACPSRAYVALPPGAMVRLGSGSRLVTLLGPPDEAGASKAPGVPQPPPVRTRPGEAQYSAARAAQRAERIAATTGRSAVSADDLHGGGAGWGFDADAETSRAPAEEAALDALELEQLLKMADAAGLPLSARGRVLQEQRSKRQAKAENLLLEVGRIAAKEVEGLSEGQASAKQRAEERAAELNEQARLRPPPPASSRLRPAPPRLRASAPPPRLRPPPLPSLVRPLRPRTRTHRHSRTRTSPLPRGLLPSLGQRTPDNPRRSRRSASSSQTSSGSSSPPPRGSSTEASRAAPPRAPPTTTRTTSSIARRRRSGASAAAPPPRARGRAAEEAEAQRCSTRLRSRRGWRSSRRTRLSCSLPQQGHLRCHRSGDPHARRLNLAQVPHQTYLPWSVMPTNQMMVKRAVS